MMVALTPGALVALAENQDAAISRIVGRMLERAEGTELDEYQLDSAQDSMAVKVKAFEELRSRGFITLEDAADQAPRHWAHEEGSW